MNLCDLAIIEDVMRVLRSKNSIFKLDSSRENIEQYQPAWWGYRCQDDCGEVGRWTNRTVQEQSDLPDEAGNPHWYCDKHVLTH